jgi:beta-1,3-galactosyltransferase 1
MSVKRNKLPTSDGKEKSSPSVSRLVKDNVTAVVPSSVVNTPAKWLRCMKPTRRRVQLMILINLTILLGVLITWSQYLNQFDLTRKRMDEQFTNVQLKMKQSSNSIYRKTIDKQTFCWANQGLGEIPTGWKVIKAQLPNRMKPADFNWKDDVIVPTHVNYARLIHMLLNRQTQRHFTRNKLVAPLPVTQSNATNHSLFALSKASHSTVLPELAFTLQLSSNRPEVKVATEFVLNHSSARSSRSDGDGSRLKHDDHNEEGVKEEDDPFSRNNLVQFKPLHRLLIGVMSKTTNYYARMAIRTTWALFARDFGARVLFVLGCDPTPEVNQRIQAEDNEYGDILQLDFVDHYYNLTLKSLALLAFAQDHCSQAENVFKIDDDVLPNWPMLLRDWKQLLDPTNPNQDENEDDRDRISVHRNYLLCNEHAEIGPIRDPNNKWYAPHALYNRQLYPSYCAGPIYMLSKNAITSLMKVLPSTELFYLEDVFVTGILREKAPEVKLIPTDPFLNIKPLVSKCNIDRSYFHHAFTAEQITKLWPVVLGGKCDNSWFYGLF